MNDSFSPIISMTGATGFVGSNLSKAFDARKWTVLPLGRKELALPGKDLASKMNGSDIIVNLAGAPVVGKWTEEHKKMMYESRINLTRKLVEACSLIEKKPDLFISTSAIGYYDSKGTHTEDQYVQAEGFLGRLAQDWEAEALKAKDLGIRTVIFRFGVVLGRDGGALGQMLKPFKLGLGGTIGDGSQPFSWIHIKDLMQAYETAVKDPSFEGIYNLTSPNPTTNKGLTMALSKALNKPAFMQVPKFVLRLQLGEGAEVLTSGQNVIPRRLLDSGFVFLFPAIDNAVKDCVLQTNMG